MALQIAERAVVGQDVEAIVGPLEGAARPMPPVVPVADIRPQHRRAIGHRHLARQREQLIIGKRGRAVERGRGRS